MEGLKQKLSENILDKFSMDFLRNQVLKNAYGNDDTAVSYTHLIWPRWLNYVLRRSCNAGLVFPVSGCRVSACCACILSRLPACCQLQMIHKALFLYFFFIPVCFD